VRLKQRFFVACGSIALVLGVVGIFLPLLPTTPFLLLASWCYLRGSERLHARLLAQRHLGPYIRAFEEGRGIPLRVKALAIITLWTSIAFAAGLAGPGILRIVMLVSAAGVTLWLLRYPTLHAARKARDEPT
jgi:hypothetical protein